MTTRESFFAEDVAGASTTSELIQQLTLTFTAAALGDEYFVIGCTALNNAPGTGSNTGRCFMINDQSSVGNTYNYQVHSKDTADYFGMPFIQTISTTDNDIPADPKDFAISMYFGSWEP